MNDKVIRFPVQSWKRVKNRRGKRGVSCMVTDRWLRLPTEARRVDFGDGKPCTALVVDVMTDTSGEARKLCELVITLEELQTAVSNIRIADDKY